MQQQVEAKTTERNVRPRSFPSHFERRAAPEKQDVGSAGRQQRRPRGAYDRCRYPGACPRCQPRCPRCPFYRHALPSSPRVLPPPPTTRLPSQAPTCSKPLVCSAPIVPLLLHTPAYTAQRYTRASGAKYTEVRPPRRDISRLITRRGQTWRRE